MDTKQQKHTGLPLISVKVVAMCYSCGSNEATAYYHATAFPQDALKPSLWWKLCDKCGSKGGWTYAGNYLGLI